MYADSNDVDQLFLQGVQTVNHFSFIGTSTYFVSLPAAVSI